MRLNLFAFFVVIVVVVVVIAGLHCCCHPLMILLLLLRRRQRRLAVSCVHVDDFSCWLLLSSCHYHPGARCPHSTAVFLYPSLEWKRPCTASAVNQIPQFPQPNYHVCEPTPAVFAEPFVCPLPANSFLSFIPHEQVRRCATDLFSPADSGWCLFRVFFSCAPCCFSQQLSFTHPIFFSHCSSTAFVFHPPSSRSLVAHTCRSNPDFILLLIAVEAFFGHPHFVPVACQEKNNEITNYR